jgi:hypothetical protein
MGMFLVRFDGAWLDHAAWRQKYRIASAEHLAAANASGAAWCWIDPLLGSVQAWDPALADAAGMTAMMVSSLDRAGRARPPSRRWRWARWTSSPSPAAPSR